MKRKAEVWQPDERNNGLFQDNDSKEEISKEYDHKNVRLYLYHTHLYGTGVPQKRFLIKSVTLLPGLV